MSVLNLIAGIGNCVGCIMIGVIYLHSLRTYREDRAKNEKLVASYKEATERLVTAAVKAELKALEGDENPAAKVIFS